MLKGHDDLGLGLQDGSKGSGGRVPRKGGFILIEAMMATAIFVLAVLSLARCVEAGIQAGNAIRDDARARRALVNWMRELQAGAQPYADNPSGIELKGEFEGMKIRQKVVPLELTDTDDLIVDGLLDVMLDITWERAGRVSEKSLRFYAYPMSL